MSISFAKSFVLVIGAALVSGTAVAAEATEWFVAPRGSGSGTTSAPFGGIQDALTVAQPGDTVTVRPGTYAESIRTRRGGSPGLPIRVRAEGPRGSVLVTARGQVLRVNHPYVVIEGLVLDGQYGVSDTVSVGSRADFFTIRASEVRRSSRDLIDIESPRGVLIDGCLIHHALDAAAGRTDAHGIAASAVRNLTIRDTEIHTFSGDGLQVDSERAAPGWNHVTVERSRIWLGPLPAPTNGFAAGVVPGENAIDTKANARFSRATLVIRDSVAFGFRNGLLSNMAALNLKENVEVVVDGMTIYDSEIAFRLRGPTSTAATGAHVTLKNSVVYNTAVAFRYENDIKLLNVWNSTLGTGVTRAFHAVLSDRGGLDVRNLLVLGSLPAEASNRSNRSVTAVSFVNASTHNYALASGSTAIDSGVALDAVTTDRAGVTRPRGKAYDVGAFEWVPCTPRGGGRNPRNPYQVDESGFSAASQW